MLNREKNHGRPRAVLGWIIVALLICGAAGSGWTWIALAYNAATYRTTSSGETANVVLHRTFAYASLGMEGLEIVDLTSGETMRIPPPSGSESIDDLSVADGLLFALDARPPGHLSVFSLSDPSAPLLVSTPVDVEVGPFSGISAGGGHAIVSGGTSLLSLHTYDVEGRLSREITTIDLGRGQPDVLITPDGKRALVSTHDWGPYFGVTLLEIDDHARALSIGGTVELETYGFTPGGAKPASFPIEAALVGDRAVVAQASGLSILSIADPKKPRLLGTVDVGVKAVNVDAEGNMIAVVGSSPTPRLVILTISDPASPIIRQSIPLPEGSYATSVAIGANHIVVATHKSAPLIFQRVGWSIRPERNQPS